MTEEILGCLHIHAGIIEHGGVSLPKLVSGESIRGNDFGIAPVGVPPRRNQQYIVTFMSKKAFSGFFREPVDIYSSVPI